ncbi:hypothetical protein GCM10011591_41450 [Nocardia camponoti]|uniref:HD Cas3-type domain-containing protein n=2 Tax=Nocardia camponoti TaxID=1616106 RepID=A0A917QSD3_9NOCA|nr:hypothetical protein GCM10011591_41450 [Nocardia camponoti]
MLANPQTPVMSTVAELLWELHGVDRDASDERSPLHVTRLRGGVPSSRGWVDYPAAPSVICATPDMWGSRLLFRGYGTARLAWPRAAGLLAVDSVVVIDEAHLSRQLTRTARRVAALVTVAERGWTGPTPLQVVETTATPDQQVTSHIGVDEADVAKNPVLADRLQRPKPVALVPVSGWSSRAAAKRTADALATQAVNLLGDETIGVFANTIQTAIAVATTLRKKTVDGRALNVVLICGQVRAVDLELLSDAYPGIFTTEGNPDVDVIVSTQSLEVGVDLDFAAIVTELASGSALAQRAGRVNRRGRRDSGPVVVVVPDEEPRSDSKSPPYEGDELVAAYQWLTRRADSAEGLAPWALRGDPPPVARDRRKLLQRPEIAQAWHWARTSDDLAADPTLDLWLSDSLEPDFTVGIVVRELPEDDADALDLVRSLRPRPHETFPVRLSTARTCMTELYAATPDVAQRAILVRGTDVEPVTWTGTDKRPQLRPGDVVVVGTDAELFTETGDKAWPPVVAPEGPRHTADDVLESVAKLNRELRPGEVVHRIDLAGHPQLANLLKRDQTALDISQSVASWLDSQVDSPMAAAAAKLLRDAPLQTDVQLQYDEDPEDGKDDDEDAKPTRVVIIDGRRATADEDLRQERTENPVPVLLDSHQRAVADRVEQLAVRLRIPADLVRALREAALHHDDGKTDPRFQIRLGARPGVLLAKSRLNRTPDAARRQRDNSGLPPGWRHEQRSVVDAWDDLEADRPLTARLIGTTHGHGRSGFPHTSAELLGPTGSEAAATVAAMLFDEGGWDELMEQTDREYGVWICAYLEAILRAADGRVSAEGN